MHAKATMIQLSQSRFFLSFNPNANPLIFCQPSLPLIIYSYGVLSLIFSFSPLPQNRVFLHATDESALKNGISMDLLRKFSAEGEAQGGGAALEKKNPITPGVTGGIAKETH